MGLEAVLDEVIRDLLVYGPPLAVLFGATVGLFHWGGERRRTQG